MGLLVVFSSAGHHNRDSGAVYNGRFENKETIAFRNLLNAELSALGIKTISDKDTETNREYQNRMKAGTGSVVLDIHFNAGSPTATGTECLVNSKDFADKNSMSYRIADEVCKATAEILGIKNRGVKSETATRHGKLGILSRGAGCSVLWEICFISNIGDMARYDTFRSKLVRKIAEICKKYDDMK